MNHIYFGLSFAHWLVVASAFLSIAGALTYTRDTWQGKIKPNLVTWTMWTIAPLLGTAAALAAHADPWSLVRVFLAGFMPLILLVVVVIRPQGYWKLTPFDFLCGIFSLAALIAWLFVDSPRVAVVLSALGDLSAALPTIVKSWKYPETESGINYTFGLLSALLVFPAIPIWNVQNVFFQGSLLIVNLLLVIAVYRKHIFTFAWAK